MGPLIRARDQFVASAAARVGTAAAPTVVAALDGLVLDALIRGGHDPDRLRAAVRQILASVTAQQPKIDGGLDS